MTSQPKRSRSIETQPCASAGDPGPLPWEVEMLPPSSLRPAKRNARTHNEAQTDLIANSLLR
jgi:hypothetical protein